MSQMRKTTRIIRIWTVALIFVTVGVAAVAAFADDSAGSIPPVPTPGMVTMVDLGAHKCIPCKMMAPIIAELQKAYAGRASIIFIDVWQHRDQVERFGIRGIPTQIFYDQAGREVGRHIGFLDKKGIVETFQKLGVPDVPGN